MTVILEHFGCQCFSVGLDHSDAQVDIDFNSQFRKVLPSNKRLESEIREMLSIHASINNEMLLTEQSRRSLLLAKSELENRVMKLREIVATAERDLLRLQVGFLFHGFHCRSLLVILKFPKVTNVVVQCKTGFIAFGL